MKLEIVSKSENKLMDRVDVEFKTDHVGEPSPNRDAVRTALAGALGVQKERVVVSDMASRFGMGASDGYAKVYGSVDSAKKYEANYLLVRNGLAEKKAKKPKPAPAAKKKKAK
ncbi:MAG: 30S ribosomal protein S24e [Methanomassiliicoccus sp.]|nr:30S ribosomal protein S24e [Methanomassiliicoccus sp.]